eukprot:m.69757 g.69757  ORF g.69757 m.69757 type:complete len:139 (+) comp35627_c0_seq1:425-841(+)
MVYARGSQDDMKEHAKHHKAYLNKLRYPDWRNAQIVEEYKDGSKIVKVLPDDAKSHWKKVDEIFSIANTELGCGPEFSSYKAKDTQVLLYINKKTVIGFLAAVPLKEAHKIQSDVSSAVQFRYCTISKAIQLKRQFTL